MDNLRLTYFKELWVSDELGLIKQPTVRDIIFMSEKKFYNCLIPFTFIIDMLNLDNKTYKDFDLFFIRDKTGNKAIDIINENMSENGQVDYFDSLIRGLKLFYNTEDIQVIKDKNGNEIGMIMVDGKYLIDRDNYGLLRDTILETVCQSKMEIKDEEEERKSSLKKMIDDKINAGRKRQAEKNSISLYEIIEIVQFFGDNFIGYDKVLELTYYQLYHAYKMIMKKEAYNINKISTVVPILDTKGLENVTHWFQTLKQ